MKDASPHGKKEYEGHITKVYKTSGSMITLQRPDSKTSAFLGERKGIKDGDMVRPSQFAMPMHLGKRRVIYNTLTGHCIESNLFDWFENPAERVFDEADTEMAALVKRDFLVSPDLDETGRYARLIKTLRAAEKPKRGYSGYTILPTTACNARCVYCCEEGIPYETMNDETIEQTIRYILATRRDDTPVSLHWFGGEPLMGEKAIDRICAALRDADIKYKSNVISNGSLMTEELAEKVKEDWHLTNIQITLDGREKVYCERKRYVAFDGSPYRAVLDGIHAMMNQGIRVSIRLNVDEDNLDEMMALIDELEGEFSEDSQVSIYCHSIFAEEGDELRDNDELYDKMAILNERLHEFNENRRKMAKEGEGKTGGPGKKPHYDRRGYTKRYFCMVDSPQAGGVILPNGDICFCEHIRQVPVVGSVFDEASLDREAFIKRGREDNKKCAACALLPVCTDFMGCPSRDRDCIKERTAAEKRNLRNLEDEDRLPPINIAFEGRIVRVVEPTPEFAESCVPILADDYLKPDETIDMEEAKERFNIDF